MTDYSLTILHRECGLTAVLYNGSVHCGAADDVLRGSLLRVT